MTSQPTVSTSACRLPPFVSLTSTGCPPTSYSVFLVFLLCVRCLAGWSLSSQMFVRRAHTISASVSCSGDLHKARWFGFWCGLLRWLHDPCTRCKGYFDSTSFPWFILFFCSSAVRVHVSHAYSNIDMASDRISLILDQRVMFLSFHIGFNLVIVAVVWAILEMISGLDPSSVTTEPRYLKLDTVSNLCPLTLIFLLMPLMLLVNSLVFSALFSIT